MLAKADYCLPDLANKLVNLFLEQTKRNVNQLKDFSCHLIFHNSLQLHNATTILRKISGFIS